jgi:2-C-methyl-D-erythritol 4-phosphate cytidylyltransferase
METAAVIVAGGSGLRMGGEIPKQFLPLAGVPILVRSLRVYLGWDPSLKLALVLPELQFEYWQEVSTPFPDVCDPARVRLCAGGATRTLSVFAGLEALEAWGLGPSAYVAIHDGVRPLIRGEAIAAAFALARSTGASVAAVPVKASLRELSEVPGPAEDYARLSSRAVDRRRFFEVQTPQVFGLGLILNAYRQRPHDEFTDDASLAEAAGLPVALSPGHYDNLKITTPEDLPLAERILAQREGQS